MPAGSTEMQADRVERFVSGLGTAFEALRVRNYRLFWAGQFISQMGTWVQRVAQAWLVLTLTNSPLALGTVTALQFLPILCFSLFGGMLADRLPKRRLLLVTQSLAALQALTLAGLTALGVIQLWHIYALAFLLGLINALDNPARQSFVPELVGRAQVANAVALNSMVFNASRILGPSIGGLGVATVGFSGCFLANAVSFLATIGALWLIDPNALFVAPGDGRRRGAGGLGPALRYAWRTPVILTVVILLAFVGTFGYNFTVVLPLVARYVVQVDAAGFGLMTGAMGVGSVLAALWLAYQRRPTLRRLLAGAAAFSALLLLVALSRVFLLSLGLLVVLGFASVFFTANAQTILQLSSPDEFRGRIMSLYTLLFLGTTPIGSSFVGAVAERWGVQTALAVAAGLCWVGVTAGFAYARRHAAA